jgi:hypothetical protein
MFLHLYPNWKAKEKIFAFFFKGWEYQKFKDYGEEFSLKIENMKKDRMKGPKQDAFLSLIGFLQKTALHFCCCRAAEG